LHYHFYLFSAVQTFSKYRPRHPHLQSKFSLLSINQVVDFCEAEKPHKTGRKYKRRVKKISVLHFCLSGSTVFLHLILVHPEGKSIINHVPEGEVGFSPVCT